MLSESGCVVVATTSSFGSTYLKMYRNQPPVSTQTPEQKKKKTSRFRKFLLFLWFLAYSFYIFFFFVGELKQICSIVLCYINAHCYEAKCNEHAIDYDERKHFVKDIEKNANDYDKKMQLPLSKCSISVVAKQQTNFPRSVLSRFRKFVSIVFFFCSFVLSTNFSDVCLWLATFPHFSLLRQSL